MKRTCKPKNLTTLKQPQGFYDPATDRDSCGVGFIADIQGRKSRDIIDKGLQIVRNLEHRGAVGADPETGDGAGILMQVPHRFFQSTLSEEQSVNLPAEGNYAVGFFFMPSEPEKYNNITVSMTRIIEKEGYPVIAWRDVPTDESVPGAVAQMAMPHIRQVFLKRPENIAAGKPFEQQLYLLRRLCERHVYEDLGFTGDDFYVVSLSSRTVIYKGMLKADQLSTFYPDLRSEKMESALALVHMRFSTNTLPTWDLAQPFRYIAHNGEINTVEGNRNWMKAREKTIGSDVYGDRVKELIPVTGRGDSDSASFDRVLELLVQSGRSMPHSMMMMVPEAWSKNPFMEPKRRAFYEYHATMMEPWDGPAALAFTDGTMIGATLDRNGLRPARYIVTKDDVCIMASEVGVLPVEPANIRVSSRLQPGRMLLIDFNEKRIISDEEAKENIINARPYSEWISKNMVHIEDLPEPGEIIKADHDSILERQRVFNYTTEDLMLNMGPMSTEGKEPTGSMGADNSLAVLSEKPQLLFRYFKQNFAQVTNPPIDPIREEMVMELTSYIGSEGNLLDEKPESAKRIELNQPVINNKDLARIRLYEGSFKAETLSILFSARKKNSLKRRLGEICERSENLVREGYNILILSDHGVTEERAPIPSMLAVSAVHHHLIKAGLRNRTGLILESGEPREVAHYAMLISYGANAVNPYLALETVEDMFIRGMLPGVDSYEQAEKNYIKAVDKGLLKVMSKMGISTLQSYHGGQVYEAVGLARSVIEGYFPGTPSMIGGADLEALSNEAVLRHKNAYNRFYRPDTIETGGHHYYRKWSESHLLSPMVVHKLQHAAETNNRSEYKEFSALVNKQQERLITLRGMLGIKLGENTIPLESVDPASVILKRIQTGAMSFGSISWEAHTNLAIAMNRIGGKSNSGEGGEDKSRFNKMPNGDSMRSAIKQVASGRFGVTTEYLVNASDIQIKMAQGAKPGEGGQLPGHKVDKIIAKLRYSTPGVTLISPPPHHDIYSIEDLQQLIFDLKNVNPKARISVKLVSERGVGTIAAGVAKAHADHILISGHDGGTGASPVSSLHYAGTPWEIGLLETHQALVANGLRDRVYLGVDGKMLTGRDIVVAALMGAEEFGFSTSALITQGCIMMRKCHLNTCPVGVATQDADLRKKFTGRPEYLENYLTFVAEEVREYMARLGFSNFNSMIGRIDKLNQTHFDWHYKARGIEISRSLIVPDPIVETASHRKYEQNHGLEDQLDNELIRQAAPALDKREPVKIELPVQNINRTVGAMLAGELVRRQPELLPDNTIDITLKGIAGQSFGAFLTRGITLRLIGQANDYVGKGLWGGRIIVRLPEGSDYISSENIIAGNTILYGATAGEAYFQGVVGERFCVRNSGVWAVAEGVGDHGCEYMTGGRVAVLGKTGLNFAAGMSGGIAYVYDVDKDFADRVNTEMVELEDLEKNDLNDLHSMISKHAEYTGSDLARVMLDRWDSEQKKFIKVIPTDFKRAMKEMQQSSSESEETTAVSEVTHG